MEDSYENETYGLCIVCIDNDVIIVNLCCTGRFYCWK